MLDFYKWQDELLTDAEMYKNMLIDEAKANSKSPQKAVDYLKGLKQGLPDSYMGTMEQLTATIMNKIIDDAITEIRKEAMNQDWSDLND